MIIGLYLINNNSPFPDRMYWSDKENNVVVCFKYGESNLSKKKTEFGDYLLLHLKITTNHLYSP